MKTDSLSAFRKSPLLARIHSATLSAELYDLADEIHLELIAVGTQLAEYDHGNPANRPMEWRSKAKHAYSMLKLQRTQLQRYAKKLREHERSEAAYDNRTKHQERACQAHQTKMARIVAAKSRDNAKLGCLITLMKHEIGESRTLELVRQAEDMVTATWGDGTGRDVTPVTAFN